MFPSIQINIKPDYAVFSCTMGAERRKVGRITVKVVNAKNLKNKELLSKSDPYCKVRFTEYHSPSSLFVGTSCIIFSGIFLVFQLNHPLPGSNDLAVTK